MSNVTLTEGFTRHQQLRGLRPRSIERRRMILRNLDSFTGGADYLTLTPGDIEAWLDDVQRGPRTRYSYLSCTSCFYDWAIDAELATANPARKVERPRIPRSLPRPIGRDDLAVALDLAPPMMYAWLSLGYLEGLRCQEIAGITREDVWDQDDPPMLFVREGKGGHERVVPLHPAVIDALRRCRMPRVGPIFLTEKGRQFTPDRVSRLSNDYLHSLGISAVMHQTRHRFGTDVQALGRDLRVTQELMGHQSPLSTAGYTSVNPVESATVVGQLPQLGAPAFA